MPLVEVRGGARVEIPNLAEIDAVVGGALGPEARKGWASEQHAEAQLREREHARGVKPIRVSAACNAQTIYLGGPNGASPAPGQVWQVRLLSCQVNSSDTVQAYIMSSAPTAPTGPATPTRLIQNWSTAATGFVVTFNAGACILLPDESIYLSAAAHNVTAYFLTGFQVPAEMVYKVI